MSLWSRIRADILFARERDPAAASIAEVLLAYPGVHAMLLHRLAHLLCHWKIPLIPRLISHFNRSLTGIEIHPGAEIASPCFIDHGMGVVIGETAILGKRCHLHQGVTLGGTSTRREKRHPTLRDDVTVGAGAQIIGAIVVGRGAKIGAGSVVVANVPDFATVVGVPGHVVAYYDPGNDTILRLPDPEHDRIQELEKRVEDLEDTLGNIERSDLDGLVGEPPRPLQPSDSPLRHSE
jgi:serine O-acetyltransferase